MSDKRPAWFKPNKEKMAKIVSLLKDPNSGLAKNFGKNEATGCSLRR